ncbi:MAG: MoaD/ThiS family protein [Bacteroidia bacterium]|nr:MoaD/ThiS family protein [Bacteroidia bacterium]MBT8287430.1 MoaD/ThiS family protein [Bacteroidia bacterium]NNF81838.1 MoaD/ThiS family protein [Flavobacteriaceae bacterium]NNK73778.1 MoaD/ThiS family protein [Flavobacteriaceae bacterium]
MSLTIKYFGLLTEVTGKHEEIFPSEINTVNELLKELYSRHPGLESKEFKVAVGHEIVNNESKIMSDEVALLPPFSGG